VEKESGVIKTSGFAGLVCRLKRFFPGIALAKHLEAAAEPSPHRIGLLPFGKFALQMTHVRIPAPAPLRFEKRFSFVHETTA